MSDAPPVGFPPPPPPQRKKTSGCLIALVVAGVLVLVLGIGVVAAGAWFAQTDEGKAIIAAAGVAARATEGPGPDALRAAGCAEAAAIRYDEMNKMTQVLLADAGTDGGAIFDQGIEVRCMDPKGPMTCEDVGRIFATAEKPTAEFNAVVSARQQDRCNVLMKPDGTPK